MPHTRSAKKQVRKNLKRKLHNRALKKALKLQIKKLQDLSAKGSPEDLRKELSVTVKKLDKAAAKRVIHANMAARKKSQLARLVNSKTQPVKK